MESSINLVGLELEGCWRRISRTTAIQHDHSVRAEAGFAHAGEMISPPLERSKIDAWLQLHIPDAVNETCGFHIHVSLKRVIDYNRLTTERFYKLLLKRIEEWGHAKSIPKSHHFWRRLAGTFQFTTPAGNVRNFCRKEFRPEEQLYVLRKGGEGTARHCHLNFCLALHGTVELRLFPAWNNIDLYSSSIKVFLDSIEEFLVAEKVRRNNKLKIKLGTPGRRPLRSLLQGAA